MKHAETILRCVFLTESGEKRENLSAILKKILDFLIYTVRSHQDLSHKLEKFKIESRMAEIFTDLFSLFAVLLEKPAHGRALGDLPRHHALIFSRLQFGEAAFLRPADKLRG